ncbi:MAG: hypothetical protein GWO24_18915, partial [Akkermansiaceae bacterium]|nr:hypothetical protein [Akkermansiaceae bacterium]
MTPADWRNRPEGGRRRGRGPFPDHRTLDSLDADGDKALSFEEWRKSPLLKERDEQGLREMFERLDRNNDGRLDGKDRPTGPLRRGGGGNRPEGRGTPD